MRTESGMNNMNMESTNEKARAKNMRRRILACVCAFAIAVLQCAVIVTMGTEDVHAAGSVDIKVNYKSGKTAGKNGKDISNNDTLVCTYTVTEGDVEEKKTLKLHGTKVSTIIDGIDSPSSVTAGGKEILGAYGDWILIDSVEGDIPDGMSESDFTNRAAQKYTSLEEIQSIANLEPSTNVTVNKTNKEAVTIKITGIPTDPKVNEEYQLDATVSVDRFYRDNYSGADTTLKWKSSDANAISVDNNGNIKIKSTKNATITASIYGASANKSITGKTEAPKKKEY